MTVSKHRAIIKKLIDQSKGKVQEMTLRVVQFGCGPVGCSIARLALQKANLKIVGAVALENVGRDLSDVIGHDKKMGVIISDDLSAVLNESQPSIVLHATGSSLEKVYSQLREKILNSKCEANIWPVLRL